MYYIENLTDGYNPDDYKFEHLEDAFLGILKQVELCKKRTNSYEVAKEFKDILNFTEVSWRFSEKWGIKRAKDKKVVAVFFINREHFPDGTAIVTLDREPHFGNYRNI